MMEPAVLEDCFKKIVSSKNGKDCLREAGIIKDFATDTYRLEYSSSILLFLASFYVDIKEYGMAIEILDMIVGAKDPVWASMAQCVIGRISYHMVKSWSMVMHKPSLKVPKHGSSILENDFSCKISSDTLRSGESPCRVTTLCSQHTLRREETTWEMLR